MTVYVDDMYTIALGVLRGMRMSHMIADTEEELHAMAERIGMQRRWYQGDHYDVSLPRRVLAVQAGAVELPMRILATMAGHRWRTGALPGSDEVPAILGERARRHAGSIA